MTVYFHGAGKRGPYFEGWYFKQQTARGDALALIPALHIDRAGVASASLQVLAGGQSWFLDFPAGALRAQERAFCIELGRSRLSASGLLLDVEREGLSLHGALQFGALTPLRSDIMGPFRLLADMECAHGVLSMGHALQGAVTLNGARWDFTGGRGYIETDRGSSFPSRYLWTQCAWPGASLMLSIATIPLGPLRFTGCICAVLHGGREYRLATYQGARVERWGRDGALLRQGKLRLAVEPAQHVGRPLRAPAQGDMGRIIHESLCTRVRYRLWRGDALLFDHTDCFASFEYAD